MQIGMIGLGKMGMNMTRRLLEGKHEVVVFDLLKENIAALEKHGASGANTLEELVQNLNKPRVVWMMLRMGKPIEETISILQPLLSPDDILIDGGNSYYRDDLRRGKFLDSSGVHYLDIGVSGGIWGLKEGYCMMVGGKKEAFHQIEPVLQTLAPKDGYLYCGSTGAGHFVKMVHNGIEYALMEAYGEGFDLLKHSPYGKEIHFGELAYLWNQGSVIRSWLLELLESVFEKDPDLGSIKGYVEDTGEGRWTVQEAVSFGVAADVIALSLFKRFQSRQEDLFSSKIVAALRKEFGGHAIAKAR